MKLFYLLCLLLCIRFCLVNGGRLRLFNGPAAPVPPAVPREVYANGRLFDISHRVTKNTPSWASKEGLGQFLRPLASIKNGSAFNAAEVRMSVHTATHVDSPAHFFDNYADAGYDVDSLDLEVLNGPALLIDVPRDKNITANVMKSLKISKGVRRVLFRTANTDRKLMFKKEFDSSYTGFTKDGAKWLVENTDIKLVGLDYLSVAVYDQVVDTHHEFLANRETHLVEGLKLDNIPPGLYNLHCLPVRLAGSDGSPTRCILIK